MAVIDGFFKKGSSSDYAALYPKDPNTFYYVDEEKLYLGEILLSEDEEAVKMAEKVSIADTGNFFESDNVEGALAEIAQMIPSEISVVEESNIGDVLKKYIFYKGEQIPSNVIAEIDIPKDIMSVSGTVVSEDASGNPGTFIKLNLGTSADDEKSSIYIDLVDLITDFTADKIIYKNAVAYDPASGTEAQDAVSVKDALDDIYSHLSDGIKSSSFVWEDMSA